MPRAYRPVVDVDCTIEDGRHIRLADHVRNQLGKLEGLDERVEHIKSVLVEASSPHGTYKLYNPAPCTLPPAYTEPAIKLVGTMSVLHGKTTYDKLSKASQCALMGACLGKDFDEASLRNVLVHDDADAVIFDALIAAMVEYAANIVNAAIVKTASDEGYYTDDYLGYSEDGDFPLESLSDILFYMKGEERLGMGVSRAGRLTLSSPGTVGLVGIFDPDKGPKRSCGLCKFRDFCSIRAIGMTCHGKKGSFQKQQ